MSENRDEELATSVAKRLRAAGHTALLAGGCVRDRIMGRMPKDYDIATDATPDQVEALFDHTHALGKAFGVIQVLIEGRPFEVATFRNDLAYIDGRRPTGVVFSTPREDAERRDFTINGLFLEPETGEILDFVGGQADIQRRVIRAIGEPARRFEEDYLRMLRAVRFASVLGFDLEPATAEAIRKQAPCISQVSAERIQQELSRILTESPQAGRGFRLLQELGLLPVILPEISVMIGCEQPPQYHPEGDVFVHTMIMLDRLMKPSATLAWSVLLHDVGKPPTFSVTREPDGSDRIRFMGHADVGSRKAEEILRRLRCSNDLIDAVVHCVKNHMRLGDASQMRESTLRKLVAAPTFETELELHRVDCLSSHGELGNYDMLRAFAEKIQNEPVLPAPFLRGQDVLALGVRPGREIGDVLHRAYDLQLEGTLPDRESALVWLQKDIAAKQAG